MRNLFRLKYVLKTPLFFYYLLKTIYVFKKPFTVFAHYVLCTSPKEKFIELRNGIIIHISDHPHDIITIFVIFIRNDYDTIKKGSTVIDIGANIGVFSLFAITCGAEMVYAYEPNLEAFKVFEKNIMLNKLGNKITAHKLAVSADSGTTIKIPKTSSPYNQMIVNTSPDDNYESVLSTSIDDIVMNNGLAYVDLLKCDCEGAEYPIFFNSHADTLEKIREIRMEFHEGPIDRLIAYLSTKGFKMDLINYDSATLFMKK